MMVVVGAVMAGSARAAPMPCRVGLSSAAAGEIALQKTDWMAPILGPSLPAIVVHWRPPASGSAIVLGLGVPYAQDGAIGAPHGGHVEFRLPSGAAREHAVAVFEAAEGPAWRVVQADLINGSDEAGAPATHAQISADEPRFSSFMDAITGERRVRVSLVSGGTTLVSEVVDFSSTAERNLLIRKARGLADDPARGSCRDEAPIMRVVR